MATHKSALKKARQDAIRRERNRAVRSRLRTAIKKLRQRMDDGDAAGAKDLLPGTLSLIDRTARRRVIDAHAAARTKSRLTRSVNKLS